MIVFPSKKIYFGTIFNYLIFVSNLTFLCSAFVESIWLKVVEAVKSMFFYFVYVGDIEFMLI